MAWIRLIVCVWTSVFPIVYSQFPEVSNVGFTDHSSSRKSWSSNQRGKKQLTSDELSKMVSNLEDKISAFKTIDEEQRATIELLKNDLLKQRSKFLELIQQLGVEEDSGKPSSNHLDEGAVVAPTDISENFQEVSVQPPGKEEKRYSGPDQNLQEQIFFLRDEISHLTKDNRRKAEKISTIQSENVRLSAVVQDQSNKIEALQSQIAHLDSKIERSAEEVVISKKELDRCSYYYNSQRKRFQSVIESMWGTMNSLALEKNNYRDELERCMVNDFPRPMSLQSQGFIPKSSDLISALQASEKSIALHSIVEYVANLPDDNSLQRLHNATREKLQLQPCVLNEKYESLQSISNDLRMKLDGLKTQLEDSENSKNLLVSKITTLKSQVSVMHKENTALEVRLKSAEVMSRLLGEDLQKMKDFRLKSTSITFPYNPEFVAGAETNSATVHSCFMDLQNQIKFFKDIELDLSGVSKFLDLDAGQQELLMKRHPYVMDEIDRRYAINDGTYVGLSEKTNKDAPTSLPDGADSNLSGSPETDYPLAILSIDAPSTSRPGPLNDAVISMDMPVVQSDVFTDLAAAITKSTNMLVGNSVVAVVCLPIIESIKQAVQLAQKQIEEITQLNQRCNADLNKMKAERDAAQATISTLQESLTAKTTSILQLQAEVARLESARAAAEAQWKAAKATIQLRDQQLAAAGSENERLSTVISSLEVDKSTLQTSLHSCNKKLTERGVEVNALTKGLKTCKQEVDSLSQKNSQLSLTNTHLQNSLTSCNNDKNNLQDQVDTQMTDLQQCKTELKSSLTVEKTCTKNLKTCTASNYDFQNEIVKATSQYAELETRFSDMKSSIAGLNKQFSDLFAQAESCNADSSVILAAKEQLAHLLLQYQTNLTVIDEHYNQLVLGELMTMNTSLHQCESGIVDLQVQLQRSEAQMRQQQRDCDERVENVTTQMSGDCGSRVSFLQAQLQTLYETEDQMQAAINRALLLSTAAKASFSLLSRTQNFTSQLLTSTIKEQDITSHLLQLYEYQETFNVMPDIAVIRFIIQNADVIFAAPSSEYFYEQMQHQFAMLESRILKLACRCKHMGNCTMVPLTAVYSEFDVASSAQTLSTLTSSILKPSNGRWELTDIRGFYVGLPSLDPSVYTFIRDILPLLESYSSTSDGDVLLRISDKYLNCHCYPKTSGEFCEIVK